jgi:hypothetical protein
VAPLLDALKKCAAGIFHWSHDAPLSAFGPLGLFVTVFICATMGGMIGSGLLKWGGGQVYDESIELGDQIYHSVDELLGGYN